MATAQCRGGWAGLSGPFRRSTRAMPNSSGPRSRKQTSGAARALPLAVTRLPAAPAADVPRRYRAAGFSLLGPFHPAPPRPSLLPPLLPASCVTVCLRLLGLRAFVLTPSGLHGFLSMWEKKFLTTMHL